MNKLPLIVIVLVALWWLAPLLPFIIMMIAVAAFIVAFARMLLPP